MSAAPRHRRRWLRRTVLAVSALLLMLASTLAWLLWTTSGRDAALALAARALPAEALHWQRADGVIAGPLTLYGLRYQHDGVGFSARRLRIEPTLRALWSWRLQLDRIELDTATLDLPVDHHPQPPPRWPDVLPSFDVPITFDLRALDVRDLRIRRDHDPLLAIAHLQGAAQLAPGRLAVHGLDAAIDRGRLHAEGWMNARQGWSNRLDARWQAPDGGAHLHLLAGGDIDHFVLALGGGLPAPLAVKFRLDDGRHQPRWQLAVSAPRLDPQRLTTTAAGDPWSINLQASGRGGAASVQGQIGHAGLRVRIAPSQLAWDDGVLSARPLALDLAEGHIRLDGHLDLRPADPVVKASASVARLRWRADPTATPVQADGEITLAGSLDAWKATTSLDLLRDAERAHLTLAGHGDRRQASIPSLSVATPAGRLQARGQLRWSPGLDWKLDARLDRFDPGYLAPGFDGAVSAHLQARGQAPGERFQVQLDDLAGQLRGRALAGRASLDWQAGNGRIDTDLQLGGSKVRAKGTLGHGIDLSARFDPLRLEDALPDARGSLRGQVELKGTWPLPALRGQLQARDLHWQRWGIAQLSLDGNWAGEDGKLTLDARGIAGLPGLERLHAGLIGSPQHPRASLDLAGPHGALSARIEAQRQHDAWTARLDALQLAPSRGPAWTLSAPTIARIDDHGAVRLPRACLRADAASLCVQADWPHRLNLHARALPLGLLDPWLTGTGLDARARGNLDLDADATTTNGTWHGTARLQSTQGGLVLASRDDRPLLGYTHLDANATLAGERLQARLAARLDAGGSVQAQFGGGLSSTAPLQGGIDLELHDITWLELLSTDIAAPQGRLRGQLAVTGSLARPRWSGQMQLDDFRTELPALGIRPDHGQLRIDADGDGPARVTGSLRSGDGTLQIAGSWPWQDEAAPLQLTAKGDRLTVAAIPELHASASPDLQLAWNAGTLSIRGAVEVPSAKVDLERLDSIDTPSPDVVVLDPAQPATRSPIQTDLDLQLGFGDAVKLKGFGLDGSLRGRLQIRQRPGDPLAVRGALDVGGRYAAWGQQLAIQRGRLSYNGGGFDNPALDVLAQREFDDATIGVQVRGTARRPQTTIVSTPAMEPTEALAYLVTGRPLRSASADDTRQISAASTALAAGSNLIAQSIGARLGLDSAGVTSSRALGGDAFTVGKYLSPRLFVSYGVAIAGTGEVLTLKYLLRKGLDVSIESAKENRASINWRIER